MKHAVIFAHPRQKSFTASVAAAYAKKTSALGHQVVTRDLYRMKFQPCLEEGELPFDASFAPAPDVVAERKLLADVDVFALCYPFWLNAPPAMLKGYLDRVFGFGFAYGKEGRSAPLLKGRMLITFSSSGAPDYWVKETGAMEAIGKLYDRYFADLCGMQFLEHVHFGSIVPQIREDAVTSRIEAVGAMVEKHFGHVTHVH
jgi:NAD(P)H dehydrogenase (quinone)